MTRFDKNKQTSLKKLQPMPPVTTRPICKTTEVVKARTRPDPSRSLKSGTRQVNTNLYFQRSTFPPFLQLPPYFPDSLSLIREEDSHKEGRRTRRIQRRSQEKCHHLMEAGIMPTTGRRNPLDSYVLSNLIQHYFFFVAFSFQYFFLSQISL